MRTTRQIHGITRVFVIASCLIGTAFLMGCANGDNPPQQAANQVEQYGSDYFQPGPFVHSTQDQVWHDEGRGREIAIKMYVPERSDPAPVIVFSHGLGGSAAAAPYLGQHLASWGFISLHIQHPGSDIEVWRGLKGRPAIVKALRDAAMNPQTSIERYNDLSFVLDELADRSSQGELNVDLSKIGMAGHSFGAHSVLAAAGRTYASPTGSVSFLEPRVKAAVALSPPAPGQRDKPNSYPEIYGGINIPIFHMTGTEDANPLDRNQDPTSREIPFQQINGAPQYLVVFDGADHSVFGGRGLGRQTPDYYPRIQSMVAGASTAFFMAYLNADESAQTWIDGSDFMSTFSEADRVERR